MLKFLIVLLMATQALGAIEPTDEQLDAAEQFGHSRRDVIRLNRKINKQFDPAWLVDQVATDMENAEALPVLIDQTTERMIAQSNEVLIAFGRADIAATMLMEYRTIYANWTVRYVAGAKEIGDHDPLWTWLKTLHEKIESAIGKGWCEFFHLHDMWIFNHAVPVVFHPSAYALDDYLDHFAGHHIWLWMWEHHGLAGVMTYWTVQVVCSGGTAGLGLVGFACGPIATVAEHVMDKRIAPPIASRIWERASDGFQ